MGIGGLLPLLEDIHERVDLRSYAGKRVAVDVAAWLYAGQRKSRETIENNHRAGPAETEAQRRLGAGALKPMAKALELWIKTARSTQ